MTAALGRSLGPALFGVYCVVLTIFGFLAYIIDWGQATYVTAQTARGRPDEPEFFGSAVLIRVLGAGCAVLSAAVIAKIFGYDNATIGLSALAVLVAMPLMLYQSVSYLFRGRDRMDLDATVAVLAKALTLVATLVVLRFGGQITEVLWAQCLGGLGGLAASILLARRIGIKIKAPTSTATRELLWAGAPIALFSFAMGVHPLIDMLLLTRLTEPVVVGWYGAALTVLGIVVAPAAVLATASFPELSRVSSSLPDLRKVLATNARLLVLIGAFGSAVVYLFADVIVTIIFGQGRFAQTASILRAAAPFLPLLFLGFLLGNAVVATGKTKEIALGKIIFIVLSVSIAWATVGIFQARFANGAIALVVASGIAEIFMLLWLSALLPKGAVTRTTLLDLLRALLTILFTVLTVSALQPLALWFAVPLFLTAFLLVAMALRLIIASDIEFAVNIVRTRGAVLRRP